MRGGFKKYKKFNNKIEKCPKILLKDSLLKPKRVEFEKNVNNSALKCIMGGV